MNILIHAIHYAVCSARYAADAFRRLGHDVRSIGPAAGRDIWGLTLPSVYEWRPEPPEEGWQPNLIVYMDSHPAVLDVVIEGAARVVWGVDNHVRDYRRPHFDHYFLAHRHVSVMEWQDDMTHLPCAYDPVVFTPSTIGWEERRYDVAMLGVMYPGRWALVNQLKEAGLKVLYGTGLVYDGYRDAYHNARISLCQSIRGDLAQRVFETAAMGCVVLTDPCKDFSILKPSGLYVLNDGQSVVSACEEILSYPHTSERHIEAALTWAQGQTWDARGAALLQHAKTLS